MMWLFAVLVVLAMGGVAMFAAGKGAPLARVYDDRPDALVPAERPLGAEDLRRVRFTIGLRGYRMSEVDALLDRLATELEAADPPPEDRADSQPDETPAETPGEGRGDDASR